MSVVNTINNVLHANENAKRAEEAETRAKKAVRFGAIAALGSACVGWYTTHSWKKKYLSGESRIKSLEDELSTATNKISNIEVRLATMGLDEVIDVEEVKEAK